MNKAHAVAVALLSLGLSPVATTAEALASTPAATGAATQTCAGGPASATIVTPWYPVVPRIVEEQGFGAPYGSADVVVVLDEHSKVTQALIVSSTRNSMLDRAALTAARETKYALGPTSCTSGTTAFIIRVSFDPTR